MDYFNNLNPYLVRQDAPVEPAPATGPTAPIGPTGPMNATAATEAPPTSSGTPTPPLTPPPIIDQTYIENILRINIGRSGRFYFSYDDSVEWKDRMYRGVLEQAGRDHFVIHDPTNDVRYLLQLVYLDWAEFDEKINYQVPYV